MLNWLFFSTALDFVFIKRFTSFPISPLRFLLLPRRPAIWRPKSVTLDPTCTADSPFFSLKQYSVDDHPNTRVCQGLPTSRHGQKWFDLFVLASLSISEHCFRPFLFGCPKNRQQISIWRRFVSVRPSLCVFLFKGKKKMKQTSKIFFVILFRVLTFVRPRFLH